MSRLDRIARRTRQTFDRWIGGADSSDMDRFVLLIGAMKSGTSSLFHYLAEHPEVAPCSVDEPNFFAKSSHWQKGLDWYRRLWDWEPEQHAIALEASTNYAKGFKFEGVPERIAEAAEAGLEFKFLYLMRHPIERLISQYHHGVQNGWNELPEPPESPFLVFDDHLVDVSRYAAQLDRYMEHFEREDVHLVQLEALNEQPARTMRSICEFLGIDSTYDFTGLDRTYNRTDRLEIASPLWTKLRSQPAFNDVLKRRMPGVVRSGLRKLFTVRSLARRYTLSERQRRDVLDALADDMRRLRDVYGVDIDRWDLDLDAASSNTQTSTPPASSVSLEEAPANGGKQTRSSPDVSVVVPVYNDEEHIEDALDSVQAQTWSGDIEIVVVDDGSTDRSGERAASHSTEPRVIAQENTGVSGARRRGIEASTGTYVAFLDADDRWRPAKLERQMSALRERDRPALSFTRYRRVAEDDGEIAQPVHPERDLTPGPRMLLERNVVGNSTVVVHRACLEYADLYPDEPILDRGGQDYALWLRVASAFPLVYVPDVLVEYGVHASNRIGTDPANHLRGALNALHNFHEWAPERFEAIAGYPYECVIAYRIGDYLRDAFVYRREWPDDALRRGGEEIADFLKRHL